MGENSFFIDNGELSVSLGERYDVTEEDVLFVNGGC
jgi:hypothetical protein